MKPFDAKLITIAVLAAAISIMVGFIILDNRLQSIGCAVGAEGFICESTK